MGEKGQIKIKMHDKTAALDKLAKMILSLSRTK
jgi:hypothetical protein